MPAQLHNLPLPTYSTPQHLPLNKWDVLQSIATGLGSISIIKRTLCNLAYTGSAVLLGKYGRGTATASASCSESVHFRGRLVAV